MRSTVREAANRRWHAVDQGLRPCRLTQSTAQERTRGRAEVDLTDARRVAHAHERAALMRGLASRATDQGSTLVVAERKTAWSERWLAQAG